MKDRYPKRIRMVVAKCVRHGKPQVPSRNPLQVGFTALADESLH